MDSRLTSLELEELFRSLLDFLIPRVCAVCGRQLLPGERHLCCVCMADLPLTHFERMVRNPMADKYNALVDAPGYERAAALFCYSGAYGRISRGLKYGRNFSMGRYFASMLGSALAGSGLWDDVSVVCPVPLHWTRRFARGYNQAEIIGKEVARALGVRFEPRLLRRVRRTESQTRLSAEERRDNISDAFAVSPDVARSLFSGGSCFSGVPSTGGGDFEDGGWAATVRPPAVLLVDDVFTTGSTVAACAAALRKAFGPDVRIGVATLAYDP